MSSYNRLEPADKVVSTDKITTNTWVNNLGTLNNIHSSSTNAVYSDSTSQGNS